MNPARLERAVRILEYLAHHQEGAPLKSICDELSVPMSSAHDLLAALVSLDAVRFADQKSYVLGPRALVMALAITDSVDIRHVSRPFLAKLCEAVNENSYLAVRTGDVVTYAERYDAGQTLSVVIKLGNPRPLHSTSVGKLITAHNSDLQQLVLASPLTPETRFSKTSADEIQQEWQAIREQGYCVSDGESVEGIVALATPIFDARGTVSAAVHISAPRGRLNPDRLPICLHEMLKTSALISEQIGAAPELVLTPSVDDVEKSETLRRKRVSQPRR